MPMILVKKNPRGKVIRELSSEEETAVKTVCGLKRPATMAQHNLANDLLWICPYISRHLLSLTPLQARCRRYSRGER